MSDAQAKAERSKAKDIRQGVTEQKPLKGKSKKKHTHRIVGEYASKFFLNFDWLHGNQTIGKYSSLKAAQTALAALSKQSIYTNLRIEEL
jgi:hypothetical protein